jgi:Zn-dependent protease with chaperone function
MKKTLAGRSVSLASALVLGLLSAPLVSCASTATVPARGAASDSKEAEVSRAQPGFNLFSVEQDIEIGRQSAAEVQRELPMLNDRSVDRYVGRIVERLAAVAPGARYPYQIKAVNAAEINAFALPGGPMYVNRGLLEAARSEAELAGVLAHELSHVALRHGTHQASKAYLAQAGLGILGGLLGRNGGNTAQIVNAIGGLGLNAAFLKFGRDAEYQADQLGAEIMARAGYNPTAMADFFQLLRGEQGRDPGKLEQFFSDHPPAADREARIRQQARTLGPVRSREVGGFKQVAAELRRLPAAPSRQAQRRPENPREPDRRDTRPVEVRVERPSSRFEKFEQRNGLFTIEHPDNWRAYASDAGYAVSIAPEGGVVTTADGHEAMLYGVIVNHYAPFEDTDRRRGSLEDATDDLVRQITRSNSYLRAQDDSPRREQIDDASALSVVLSGRSPLTGEEERVTVFTRSLSDDHVIYALCIAPGRDYDSLARTFSQMMRTLRINDEAAHRGARTLDPAGVRRGRTGGS